MELKELTNDELENIDGGFLPLIIIGAALLLTSCTNQNNSGGTGNINVQCENCEVKIYKDSVTVIKK